MLPSGVVTVYEWGASVIFVMVADLHLPSSLCILTLSPLFRILTLSPSFYFELEVLCVDHNIVFVFSNVLVDFVRFQDLFSALVVHLMWEGGSWYVFQSVCAWDPN